MEWHQESHILFAGAVEGETWMWKIPSGDCKTIAGFGIQNECGKLLPDGKFGLNYSDTFFSVLELIHLIPYFLNQIYALLYFE